MNVPDVQSAWAADTSVDPAWTADNPSLGQCAVTALVVQDRLGGRLLRTTVNGISHYLNEINGALVDLTIGQFGPDAWYDTKPIERDRSYVLSFAPTVARYHLLRDRLG